MTDKKSSDETDEADEDDSLAELAKSVGKRRQSGPDPSSPQDSLSSLSDSVDEFIWGDREEQSTDDAEESDSPPDLNEVLADRESQDGAEATVLSQTDRQKLADADNLLILGPLRGPACTGTCVPLLATPRADSVMFVTAKHSVENRLEALRDHANSMPDRVAVIRVGAGERTRERSTLSRPDGPMELAVEGVDDPSDLTRLGIAINRNLSAWNDASKRRICIHSLTELLQYVDQQRLFRFVHILQAKLEKEDTVAHFHLEPSSHSPQTVSVFRTLFDYVVEVGDDGAVSVSQSTD